FDVELNDQRHYVGMVFNTTGTYPYHCKYHAASGMTGVIVVHDAAPTTTTAPGATTTTTAPGATTTTTTPGATTTTTKPPITTTTKPKPTTTTTTTRPPTPTTTQPPPPPPHAPRPGGARRRGGRRRQRRAPAGPGHPARHRPAPGRADADRPVHPRQPGLRQGRPAGQRHLQAPPRRSGYRLRRVPPRGRRMG